MNKVRTVKVRIVMAIFLLTFAAFGILDAFEVIDIFATEGAYLIVVLSLSSIPLHFIAQKKNYHEFSHILFASHL